MNRAGLICLIFFFFMALPGSFPPAYALEDADLYKATAFVTGTQEPERSRGFREGLRQVVVKLTGNPELVDSPGIAAALERPADFIAQFSYEDRMKGLAVHDEQGTRERPHFLFITFDRAKLDAFVASMGAHKWPLPRPRLTILLTIRDARRGYVLTRDGEHGYGQREALKSVAEKRGVPILLPPRETVTVETLGHAGDAALRKLSEQLAGDCPLAGNLALDAAGFYWDMRWTLVCQGRTQRWSLSGVSFDTALTSGIAESARLISANR